MQSQHLESPKFEQWMKQTAISLHDFLDVSVINVAVGNEKLASSSWAAVLIGRRQ